ncbi:hypothetical protein HBE96_12995 [Clostridium sp. P21]|uniref:Uncharacterized protein n=1 Tax=Clostridium muellerianum TaxID=2716538 RepID=A0A7Y0EHH9_9CLOT|nr:hypothetical protein [Clostridium muellerianum]NMM63575.1 hypothetical protein [Clostridium muellerianum]
MVSLNFLDEQAKDKDERIENLTEVISSPEKNYTLEKEKINEDNSDFSILYIIFSVIPMVILLILFGL